MRIKCSPLSSPFQNHWVSAYLNFLELNNFVLFVYFVIHKLIKVHRGFDAAGGELLAHGSFEAGETVFVD